MNRSLLRRAAKFVDAEATLHRESCQIAKPAGKPLEWACTDCDVSKCPTKRLYEELRKVAADLRKEARTA